MDFVVQLKDISLFAMMDSGDLKKIAKHCTEHTFADGELITREGDHDGRMVVVSGQVRVVKDLGGPHERQVALVGPRSYFGERALVDDFRRTASVLADGPVADIALDPEWNFREYIKKYPSLAIELLQNLARRLRSSEAMHC